MVKRAMMVGRSAYGMACSVEDDGSAHAIMFGGDTGQACQRLNDVWKIPVEEPADTTHSSHLVEAVGKLPPARSNCAACIQGNELYIYGGWDSSGTVALNDLWRLSLRSKQWRLITLKGLKLPSVGQPGMIGLTDQEVLIVFGGWNGKKRHNELFCVDLESEETSVLNPKTDEKPPARADHTCTLWRYCDDGVWKDLLICFGGSTDSGTVNDLWLFDFRWRKWTQGFCGGQGPSPRSSHAAAIHEKSFLVLGGQSKGEVFADCYMLDLNNLIWHQVEIPGLTPLCRHSLALHNGHAVTFGGFNGEQTLEISIRIDFTEPLKLIPHPSHGRETEPAKELGSITDRDGGGVTDIEEGIITNGCSRYPQLPKPDPEPEDEAASGSRALERRSSRAGLDDELSTETGESRVVAEGSRLSWLRAPLEMARRLTFGWNAAPGGAGAAPNGARNWARGHSKSGAGSSPNADKDKVMNLQARLVPNGTSTALDELDISPPENQSVPLEKIDLPEEMQDLKGWRLVKAMHETACALARDTYIDPASGYSVFTSRRGEATAGADLAFAESALILPKDVEKP